uniref:Uncharacterized protein n=1 Tax=Anopheles atroparvus TaxID=41427 RepID=A0A182IKQ1_ANOAO
MCIQAVEVYRNPGSASNPSGHVVPRLSSEPVPAPTNQPMDPTGARAGLLTGRRQWQDPLRRSLEGLDRDRLARTQHPSIVSRSVAWCSTVSFRLSLAFVALVRQAATIATSLHTRHRSVVSVLLHHRQQQQRQHEGRQRRRPPRRQGQRKVNRAKEVASLAPPLAPDIATGEHPAGKRMHLLPPVDLATKLVLLTMVLIAVVGHSEGANAMLGPMIVDVTP